MKNHTYKLKNGITATPEFEKKKLAEFAVNVGLRCGHDCTYCSSRATLRMHQGFKDLGEKPFGTGYSIVDPDIPERVAHDAIATGIRMDSAPSTEIHPLAVHSSIST